MLGKLTLRNAKRSMKDYMIYLITMGGVAAFMYAFNSLIFSDMVQSMAETAMIMVVMIGLITVFIVLIVAWLINYMVRFMLEKRSREFGTYLLLGMEKKQVSKLYMRENMLLGILSFAAGFVAGVFLQQVVMTVFYRLFSEDYQIQLGSSPWCLAITAGCYLLCYVIALFRNRKTFQKMTISDFMEMEKSQEAMETGKEKWKQWLFFLALIYFVIFFAWLFCGSYTIPGVFVAAALFLASIYAIYQGLAAFLVCYIKRGGRKVYQRDGLFLLRQLSSKMRTMRFTMGTLTVLFTGALLGGSVSMMFASYQKPVIESAMPFDIMIYSADAAEEFEGELEFLAQEGIAAKEHWIYRIYQYENTHEMNDYLYTHVANLLGAFTKEDGSLDEQAVAEKNYCYHEYDTYMKLSDYNKLRSMLGYEAVDLQKGQYCLHLDPRVLRDIEPGYLEKGRILGEETLQFAGAYTEDFAQNGLNGADYIIIVPDSVGELLTPYYSLLSMNIEGTAPDGLQERLEEYYYHARGLLTEDEAYARMDELEAQGASQEEIDAVSEASEGVLQASGSDQILTVGCYDVVVKDNLSKELLAIISSVTFPLVYISLIFICVAFTILAVQQLSDSTRYRYRYDVLRKLGVGEKELNRLIFKQLAMYYLIPIGISFVLAGVIGIYAGERFVFYTGADNNALSYFGMSVLVFLGTYLLYFVATYLGFKRNVEQVFVRME